jgi:hypothetical protein
VAIPDSGSDSGDIPHFSYIRDSPRLVAAVLQDTNPPKSPGRSSFNLHAELAYAQKYAKRDNPAYQAQTSAGTFAILVGGHAIIGGGPGDDCTDFVSQALLAGGWKPDKLWNDPSHTVYGPGYTGPVSSPTAAWINVKAFIKYAVDQKKAQWVTRAAAKPGDIVVADWGGGRGSKFDPSHLMIVAEKENNGQIFIDEHSNNRYEFPLYGPKGSDTIQGKVPQASFRFLRPS